MGSSQAPATGKYPEQSALARLSMHLYLPGVLNEDSRLSIGRWLVLPEGVLGKPDPEAGSWVAA